MLETLLGRPSRHLKAFISYQALKNAALPAEKYRGYKQVGRTAAPFHEQVATVASTDRLPETATLLKETVSNITLALQLSSSSG